jgi:hypothetical protein
MPSINDIIGWYAAALTTLVAFFLAAFHGDFKNLINDHNSEKVLNAQNRTTVEFLKAQWEKDIDEIKGTMKEINHKIDQLRDQK